MPHVTPELVIKAYDALMTGDMEQIEQYWAEDMNWLVPGHNLLSGWYHRRDAFINDFMATVGELSGGSFNMERSALMVSDEYSADVTYNVGYRAGSEDGDIPYQKLAIDVVHVLRWRDGKVIEGRGAIFGDGTTPIRPILGPSRPRWGKNLGCNPITYCCEP